MASSGSKTRSPQPRVRGAGALDELRALVEVRSTASTARQLGIPLMAMLLVALLWMGATAGRLFLIPACLPVSG